MNIRQLSLSHPQINALASEKEILWINKKSGENVPLPFTANDTEEALQRLARFEPYIAAVFPETKKTGGLIESPLKEIPAMQKVLSAMTECEIPGRLFLKCDSHLPVSGSVKARGGIYEVLKFAEETAIENGMLSYTDNYAILAENRFKKLFSRYCIAVGSTGNLGLSIGIISAKLGFQVTVHMSSDARQWKKDLLRSKGVTVIEYPDDYQKAVSEGRKDAEKNPMCHFIDDEGSADLFLGYSTAAKRMIPQFEAAGICCDENHPIFLYIPCGVGGAPGGITFGMKTLFGDNLHVFFAEPTHAPCMTLGMMTGLHDKISVNDIGLDGKTAADGLAVGRPSRLVGSLIETLLDGCFTVEDKKLYPFLSALADTEGIFIEPSACASFTGPAHVLGAADYLQSKGLDKKKINNAVHIFWATGGSMVPQEEMQLYYQMGKEIAE